MALVLVIDDDGVARDAFRAFLSRKGHEVLAAPDGKEGVRLFREKAPDLVILDRNLPELSGSGVFAAIRKLSATVPILVVSGYDAPVDAERYMEMGAAGFLSKGDGLSPVLEAVDRILAGGGAPAAAAGPGPGRRRGLIFAVLGLVLASAAFYVFVTWRGTPAVTEAARVLSVPPAPADPAVFPDGVPGAVSSREELLRRAMLKYADRPVVVDFLADLEKEPEAAGALAGAIGKDPVSVLSALKSEPGAYRLAIKYLTRPDFIRLMMEVRRDPELAPLFGKKKEGK